MSRHQLTFFEKTVEDEIFAELKDMKYDVSNIRKSFFARHGEIMKMCAIMQGEINVLKKDLEMKELQYTPENVLKKDLEIKELQYTPEVDKFFQNLTEFKKYIKGRIQTVISDSYDSENELKMVYDKFHEIFKTKEELENE